MRVVGGARLAKGTPARALTDGIRLPVRLKRPGRRRPVLVLRIQPEDVAALRVFTEYGLRTFGRWKTVDAPVHRPPAMQLPGADLVGSLPDGPYRLARGIDELPLELRDLLGRTEPFDAINESVEYLFEFARPGEAASFSLWQLDDDLVEEPRRLTCVVARSDLVDLPEVLLFAETFRRRRAAAAREADGDENGDRG